MISTKYAQAPPRRTPAISLLMQSQVYMENFDVAEKNLHQLAENLLIVHDQGGAEAKEQVSSRIYWRKRKNLSKKSHEFVQTTMSNVSYVSDHYVDTVSSSLSIVLRRKLPSQYDVVSACKNLYPQVDGIVEENETIKYAIEHGAKKLLQELARCAHRQPEPDDKKEGRQDWAAKATKLLKEYPTQFLTHAKGCLEGLEQVAKVGGGKRPEQFLPFFALISFCCMHKHNYSEK